MKTYYFEESTCELVFAGLGECYHLFSTENFEILFTCDEEFRAAMNAIGICACLFSEIKILTFVIMTNHLHITAAGKESEVLAFCEKFKTFLKRYFKNSNRHINWDNFIVNMRPLTSLGDIRNVIVYNNRNAYVANPNFTPFSYPWGSGKYYFNQDACELAMIKAKRMSVRDLRKNSHSRQCDDIVDILTVSGCALPLSFCDIKTGEKLFRNPAQYFFMLGRNVEKQKEIGKEIGESIFCTDDELYFAISSIAKKKYQLAPSELSPSAKVEIAGILHNEYNASNKQIVRMLRMNTISVEELFSTKK